MKRPALAATGVIAALVVLGVLLVVGLVLERAVLERVREAAGPPATCEPVAPGSASATVNRARDDTLAVALRFASPGTTTVGDRTVRTTPASVGELVLPTGHVVGADPFFLDAGAKPFARTVPAGRYGVEALVVHDTADVVAALLVRLAPAPPASATIASFAGPAPAGCPGDLPGYAVDSGTGSFAAAEVAESGDADLGTRLLAALGEGDSSRAWSRAVVAAGDAGANLVAVSSGYGDGAYASWWLSAADGAPVGLVTDFGVLAGGAAP